MRRDDAIGELGRKGERWKRVVHAKWERSSPAGKHTEHRFGAFRHRTVYVDELHRAACPLDRNVRVASWDDRVLKREKLDRLRRAILPAPHPIPAEPAVAIEDDGRLRSVRRGHPPEYLPAQPPERPVR